MSKYKKLFNSAKIGVLEIKNRIVMAPMATALNTVSGEVSDRIIRFYEERAKGGCGLIITEIVRVAEGTGAGHPCQLNAATFKRIPGLERLANAVHRHGAKIFPQLHHPGREANPMVTETDIVGPSSIKSNSNEETPRELTEEEIGEIVGQFISSAKYCQMAGMDGVELHGAHEYLIHQFMCEHSNKRTDRFGGNFSKRMQFVTDIVVGIKTLCGENFPVCIRINGDDYYDGGLTLDGAVQIAKHLESIGVDALNISAGGYTSPNASAAPISFEQGWKRHLAKKIKEEVNIPVMTCGVIRKPDFADKVLIEDNVDFVAIGRALLADPYWVNKSKSGNEANIRPCISCMHCVEQVGGLKCIKCAVNPRTSFETVYGELKTDGEGKLAVVIGGGPAGMQAAISLAKRQFNVALFEKRKFLGGYVKLGSVPPHKDKMKWLIEYMTYQMEKLGVKIFLDTYITANDIKQMNPYAIFVATGGSPIIPKIPGYNLDFVRTIDDVLSDDFKIQDKKVIVVGSGLTGLEVAEHLSVMGNKVEVIEKEDQIAPSSGGGIGTDLSPSVRDVLTFLKKEKIAIHTNTELTAINKDGSISVIGDVESDTIKADIVVLSLGVRSNRKFTESFTSICNNVFILGDAIKQGRIAEAIRTAYNSVYYLEIKHPPIKKNFKIKKPKKKNFDVDPSASFDPEDLVEKTSTTKAQTKKSKFSKETKLGILLKNEVCRAILAKHLSEEFLTHPSLKMAKGFSLEKLAKMSGGKIPPEMIKAADEDLQKIE